MFKTHYFFFISIFFVLHPSIFAQKNPGYAGKHWLLKLDAVTPLAERGVLAEIEFVAHRNLSISLSGLYADTRYAQRLPGYTTTLGNVDIPKANFRDIQVGLGLRYYLSQAMAAPKRNYIFVHYSTGISTAQGNYFKNDNNSTNRVLQQFTTGSLRSSRLNAGFGYQTIFLKRFSIDFDWGVALGMLSVDNGVTDGIKNVALIKSFSDNYGPNIVGVNTISEVPGGFGLALHLKFGILLF